MTKERRLGRGLEALLGRVDGTAESTAAPPWAATPTASATESASGLLQVSVYEVNGNPYQPRRDMDETELSELAESLKQHGLIQPIVVRRQEGRYQLVAGERRLRAAIKAGWSDVPARVVEADDRQMAELAIVENLQRKDLNAIEKALSFQQYLERYRCTQEELANRLQKSRSTIANLIRLLELPPDVQQAVRSGTISEGHARALLPLGDEREQLDFCIRIQSEGLSVRDTEAQVQDAIHAADNEPLGVVSSEGQRTSAKRRKSQQVSALEQEFRAALGTKIDIRQGAKGRGRIVIHFNNHDEFERLRDYIVGVDPSIQSQAG